LRFQGGSAGRQAEFGIPGIAGFQPACSFKRNVSKSGLAACDPGKKILLQKRCKALNIFRYILLSRQKCRITIWGIEFTAQL
jgi:hypothetical protein